MMKGLFLLLAIFGLVFAVPALSVPAMASEPEEEGNTVVVARRISDPNLMLAVPITVITSEDIRKGRRDDRREYRPECRRLWKARETLSAYLADPATDRNKVEGATRHLANAYDPYDDALDWHANNRRNDAQRICRYRPDFALKVMDTLVGKDPLTAANPGAVRALIDLHGELKRPGYVERMQELRRFLWVRGTFYGKPEELGWSEAERLAFIARDDVWQFLNAQGPQAWYAQQRIGEAYLNPLSPRFDLAKGADFLETWNDPAMTIGIVKRLMTGHGIAKDEARAERMLAKVAPHSDEARVMLVARMVPRLTGSNATARDGAVAALLGFATVDSASGVAARGALIPVLAARLKSKDDKQVIEAAQALTQYAELRAPGAAEVLLPWIDQRLQRGTDAQKGDALGALTRLMRTGNAQARALFETDLQRTGGLRDLGLATPEMLRNRTLFTTDDYPPSAIRNEEEDTIGLSLIVGPDGRVIDALVERGTSPTLIVETIRIVTRRARLNVPKGTSRYVKVRLPDVQWRLAECMKDAPPQKAVEGATVVDSTCRIEVQRKR
jgi:Gram-negative bacterial TonB protein C-terminal